jgi:hypothetical protein
LGALKSTKDLPSIFLFVFISCAMATGFGVQYITFERTSWVLSKTLESSWKLLGAFESTKDLPTIIYIVSWPWVPKVNNF